MMFPDYQRVANAGGARALREALGAAADARRQAGLTVVEIMHADRGRRRPRHVHHGREPGDVATPTLNHAREALAARAPGRAGHLPDRDRLARRRGPAGQRLAREDRHRHQHRPHGAAGPPGARPAGRRAPGPVDHPADRAAAWACAGTTSERGVAEVFDEMRQAMPQHRRHHLGAARARARASPIPARSEGDPGAAGRVHRALPDARTAGAASCRPTSSRPTSGPTPSTRSC